ncbi:chemotaxis protein CheA [Brevundimonas sp. Root1279]|uniref:chemotaxis protein CheA n=1 Tax=Brevundimonas sp. Root1279 TaxID=1736443 RepID=UPI0006FCA774|nr:chemotaxis protein CheA [Brevundimonas sp. Root1279]KQW82652.1 chemotaxis protein CheA [Brevundimonas sp. Root1279]
MSDAADPFEAIKVVFFQECDELLADLESGLLAIEAGTADDETINAVFRAVHSVKGGAGAFGLDDLVRFAHVFETLLDELRSGRKACDDVTVKTLLRASDVLNDHVSAARGQAAPVDAARSAGLVAELEALTHGEAAPAAAPVVVAAPMPEIEADEFGFKPIAFNLADLAPAPAAATGWRIVLRPHAQMYAKANETGLLLRELARLGPVTAELDTSALPDLAELEPEESYFAWTLTLDAAASEADVRDVFDFVETDCDLSVTALAAAVEAAATPAAAPDLDIAALLAKATATAPTADDFMPEFKPIAVAIPEPAPVVALAPEPVPAAVAAAAPKPTPVVSPAAAPVAPAAPPAPPAVTIRVDLDRVDRLINVVGELVIQQAMLAQRVIESGLARSSGISVGLEDLELLTREIQDSVMAIRAQPVKSVFQRMPRLVREVADMTGKRVRLVTAGEDTEVDKTVVERLAEPITHMIRNAIDHGLETPSDRAAAGKPEEGTVRLAALHRSGRIVIEISDDGKGINRERVRGIAVSRGLIAEDAVLTDDEVDNLIFLPGFSTAETITDVSGRGVGMDVVKRSIQALGGRISIASIPGKGSTFTLSLPLTLAVLDGMVVSAAEQTLVAPLSAIVESLTPRREDVDYVGGHDAVILFRERFVPLIDVGMVMGFRTERLDPSAGVAVVVETESGARAALLVDAIQGQRQVVIKSLETNYRQVEGVAAATILGDGRVALILDVDAIVATARRRPARPELKLAS